MFRLPICGLWVRAFIATLHFIIWALKSLRILSGRSCGFQGEEALK